GRRRRRHPPPGPRRRRGDGARDPGSRPRLRSARGRAAGSEHSVLPAGHRRARHPPRSLGHGHRRVCAGGRRELPAPHEAGAGAAGARKRLAPLRPHARRWLVVAALFAVTYGISTPLAAYGVFLPVLADAFGWSRGAISAALSLNLILGGVAGFAVGALADRHGPRLLLVVTVILAAAGFALVALVERLWHLYLFVGVLAGIGMSGFYLLGASTVAHWFVASRGLALAIVLVGFNLGYITGGPLAAWLIDTVGWRHAYAWRSAGCGLVTLGAALSVRLPRAREVAALRDVAGGRAPGGSPGSAPRTGRGATLHEALADPRQWYLNGSWLLQGALA